ncbi:glycerophosphodiester phosphodiesterase [Oceanomicrobium pacificus]|uniref:Glycerophosphodiester phosphodiesterase n=1 Tax=Oceanomicrobium pacificus TaxID=2692916 RepID=A0A6B0TUN3_9RHOB|nr:glycerophosphodiester phosphodiesterase [Oceanomicrobium pacificus]MXU66509.1 glycerophosphodiester phosphodiesterase [Oceanomicrobium pacificus]
MHTGWNLWKAAFLRCLGEWRQVLVIYLGFVLLGTILLWPLFGALVQFGISLSGQSAVADQDIARFLLSPVGFAGLVVIAALGIAFAALATAALMLADEAGREDHRLGIVTAMRHLAGQAPRLIGFTARLVLRVLALAAPFALAAFLVALFLLTDYDINYYLTAHPPAFWLAVALIVPILTLGAIVLVRKLLAWTLALPLTLFGLATPAESFAESRRLMEGQRWPAFSAFAIWAIAGAILLALLGAVAAFIGHLVTAPVRHDLGALAVALGLVSLLFLAGNLILSALATGTFACLLVDLLKRGAPDAALPVIGHAATPDDTRRAKLTLRVAGLALVLLVGGAIWMGHAFLSEIEIEDRAQVIAHRGAAGARPENTMDAVEKAIEDGADWVEIDVQESADGEIVVFHDSDFMKLSGDPVTIWDATRADLDRLDIGSWFGPDYADARVPLLRDVLDAAKGRAKVLIELKYYGHDQQLEARVAEIVEAAGMVDHVMLMSLKYEGVQKMKALRPDWQVGLLAATAIGDLSGLEADFLAVNSGIASPGFIRRAHAAGKPVLVWTVNSALDLNRYTGFGVDGLITDEPALARSVLAERAELTTTERLLLLVATLFGNDAPPNAYRDASP